MKKTAFQSDWLFRREGVQTVQTVTLPHDAMLYESRKPDAPSGSSGAYFEGGSYIYEKTFDRPEAEHVLFQFEGVYRSAKVFINGKKAGIVEYGYIPFFICADEYLTDGKNTIRVECSVELPESRWYCGAGIYRPVWLWTGPKDGIEPESVRISTVSYDPPTIRVQSQKPVNLEIEGVAGSGSDFELTLPKAKLWNDITPYLYEAKVTTPTDSLEVRFGIRKVEWSNKGLFINGKETLLRGGCIHHDNGILGTATYDESEYRRAKLLKEVGFNAIRSAHNPCSRAMLDACDELGLYIMDEAWDMWYQPKTAHDYASKWEEYHMQDLAAMVNRDFNHPSVILYSIGNEVSEPAQAKGLNEARKMIHYLHEADPTRAVTGGINLMILFSATKQKGKSSAGPESGNMMQGMNSTLFNMITSMLGSVINKAANSKAADKATSPILDLLDIAGYNYASGRYPLEAKAHPGRLIVGAETFPQMIAKNWALVKKYPYIVGDFMWTAWDYIGETGLGAWAYTPDANNFSKPYPWLLSGAGAMDILGNPNAEAFLAAAVWNKLSGPAICVRPINHSVRPIKAAWRGTNAIPSWSWSGCEGKEAIVEVYYDASRISLFLNGNIVSNAKVKDCKASFRVKYIPGKLEAVAFDRYGKEIGRGDLHSAAPETKISLCPEKAAVKPGEILYVPVNIADTHGVVESNADCELTATVEGGELLGFGSANPRTEERFTEGKCSTYYGYALAVIRAGDGDKLTATVSNGQEKSSVTIEINR